MGALVIQPKSGWILDDEKIKKIYSKKRNMAWDKYLEVPSYGIPHNKKRALNPPKNYHP